jgi:hypothetical protein
MGDENSQPGEVTLALPPGGVGPKLEPDLN